jgi:phosphatidylglycerol---prolipoprotein diacylglyceryl transferase
MLPVFFDISFKSETSWRVLYAISLLVIAYGAWSGWRSVPVDPKTGRASPESRRDRIVRALTYGLVFAVVVKLGLSCALPPEAPLGKKGQGFPLHTYGLLLMTGFLCAAAVCGRLAEREWPGEEGKRKRDQMQELALWVLLGGIVGSRVLFMLVNWQDTVALFRQFPDRLEDLFGGGLVFYGGLLGAMGTSWWFARKYQIPFLRLADVAIPTVSLGQCIGRLGCFSAGCCWGRPAVHVPWAVQFPGGTLARDIFGQVTHTASLAFQSEANDPRWVVESTGQILHSQMPGAVRLSQWVAEHGHTFPLHPTQIYESVGQLVLFVALVIARSYRRFQGEVLALWLMAYSVLRTTVELFRGDVERGTLHGLLESLGLQGFARAVPLEAWYNVSTSQFISLAMFAAGATLMVRGRRGVQPLPPMPAVAHAGA